MMPKHLPQFCPKPCQNGFMKLINKFAHPSVDGSQMGSVSPTSPPLLEYEHTISMRLVDPNWIHHHFPCNCVELVWIIKVNILMLIKWSHIPTPAITLNLKFRGVVIIWACNPIYYEHIFFMVINFGAIPNHIPLKYRCLIKKNDCIMHVYLTFKPWIEWVFLN